MWNFVRLRLKLKLSLSANKTLTNSLRLFAFLLLAVITLAAQVPSPWVDIKPLSIDTGVTGLKLTLRQLHTTGRLMHTVAHPDDEDGGMLTLESRGNGIAIMQLTLNRGEGGQNKVGSNLLDELGILRTLELLAADRYYGVEQRFTRVADFGFSKTPEETFQKWGGHDVALGDMVRVIRTFRPDVILTFGPEGSVTGHTDHSMASVFTTLAYEWAGRPNRFPDQLIDGVQPHCTQKLYYTTADYVLRDRPPICPSPITATIDITNYVVTKVAAFEAHTTQAPVFPIVKENILARSPREMFHLAATATPRPIEQETDLLAGVVTSAAAAK